MCSCLWSDCTSGVFIRAIGDWGRYLKSISKNPNLTQLKQLAQRYNEERDVLCRAIYHSIDNELETLELWPHDAEISKLRERILYMQTEYYSGRRVA